MTKDEAFARLARSRFRSSFKLTRNDLALAARYGRDGVRSHVVDFVRGRLAPANPANDGKQTPYRGHPAFKAMHACAMCCRGCMNKWWHVPLGTPLSEKQQERVVDFILAWLDRHGAWPCLRRSNTEVTEARGHGDGLWSLLGADQTL